MRTTIDIDDDLLAAAKELARVQRSSAGKVVSQLLRKALSNTGTPLESESPAVGGFRPFPSRGTVVTNEQINELRDKEGV